MTTLELESRLSELKAKNEAATGWGAAVGARHEEIKEIERELRRRSAPTPQSSLSLADGFKDWFDSHFLDPDGGRKHLPDWLEDDLRSAWTAALRRTAPTEPVRALEDAQGIAWFERTFGVPLGDMPGRVDVAEVRARAALAPAGETGREAVPVAWSVEWHEGGDKVRQFYADEDAAKRVEGNVRAYLVNVSEPIYVKPLFAAPQPAARIGREDWSCIADLLDDIEVDDKGMCRWADVANAQTNLRVTLRTITASAPAGASHVRQEGQP